MTSSIYDVPTNQYKSCRLLYNSCQDSWSFVTITKYLKSREIDVEISLTLGVRDD